MGSAINLQKKELNVMSELHMNARLYRENLLSDPYRPAYHFAIPDGDGRPGDSNGAFFADGRYHLMYLYHNAQTDAFHWGHISSHDLLHWRHHPDALGSENGDRGCFSGGAFVDEDGTAYLTFWKFPAKDGSDPGGIDIAFAWPPYDKWERLRPLAIPGGEIWGVADVAVNGAMEHVGCADPSNIWKKDGWYYLETGNKVVLDTYGRGDSAPEKYRGDWVDLFRSKDLHDWSYVARFYEHGPRREGWPDETEDDMCPSFLPLPDAKAGGRLTDKWLQLFISHNKGAQYYIGALNGERFTPEQHGRFSWKDNAFFAPEALIDGKNRQIMWSWLLDNVEDDMARWGWSGVYNFPRVLWYENDTLRMAPAEELALLQANPQRFEAGRVIGETPLAVQNGESFRLRARIDMKSASRAGFAVRADTAKDERTEIYYDSAKGELVMDTTRSGWTGWRVREAAPFRLAEGEKLSLDVFVDKSVVEVYANEQQAICRRVYPSDPASAVGVRTLSDGADFGCVDAWEIMPANPW